MRRGANLLAWRLRVLDNLPFGVPAGGRQLKTTARFLRIFLFARSALLSRSLSAIPMERTQKFVHVGSALTRTELPWSGLLVLVTLKLADSACGVSMMAALCRMDLLGVPTWCLMGGSCGPKEAVPGPILSWSQSFVLVWCCGYLQRPILVIASEGFA